MHGQPLVGGDEDDDPSLQGQCHVTIVPLLRGGYALEVSQVVASEISKAGAVCEMRIRVADVPLGRGMAALTVLHNS